MPLVTVVIPTWNSKATLPTAVDSILNQTDQSLELIIVNDGSTDDTEAYLSTIDHPRTICMTIPHGGVVAAMNAGIERARGEFIARMDADDYSYPERIAKQARHLRDNPEIGLVGCCVEYGGDRETQAGYARYVDWTNEQITYEAIELKQFVEFPYAHPTVMFRRELTEKFGAYRAGSFPEDYEITLRWLSQGVRMNKLPQALVRWNDLPTRSSRNDDRYSPKAFYETKAKYLARWLKKNNPHHPDVVIWGAGRPTRKRARLIEDYGIKIAGYIDIDPKKTGTPLAGIPRYYYEEIAGPDEIFVLPYVGSYGAREFCENFLQSRGFMEGKNFIHCA